MGSSTHKVESAEGVSSGSTAVQLHRSITYNRFIPLPKSDTKERIIANIDLYDFELSKDQMDKLNALDKDEHICINVTDCP